MSVGKYRGGRKDDRQLLWEIESDSRSTFLVMASERGSKWMGAWEGREERGRRREEDGFGLA
jgi:hypothetical protein